MTTQLNVFEEGRLELMFLFKTVQREKTFVSIRANGKTLRNFPLEMRESRKRKCRKLVTGELWKMLELLSKIGQFNHIYFYENQCIQSLNFKLMRKL